MNPNTILGKYLTKQIVMCFLGVLVSVLGIVMMCEIIDLLRRVSSRPDVGFGFVLQMAATKTPRTIEMIFPFVVMLSSMISFWRLSKSNEFVIIRASGVSIWGFLKPVLIAVFLIGAINVAVINPISAYLYEVHETLDYRFKTKNPSAVLFTDKGLWIREAVDDNKFVVIKAKSIRQEDKEVLLRDMDILEMDKDAQISRRTEAYVGTLDKGKFILKDVKIFEAGKPTQSIASADYPTDLTLDRIKENFVDPEAISFWKLPKTIRFYEKSGFSAQKHYMRYLSLIASPFMLCAMVLVAAVFALRPNNRKGGVMFLIVGGITTGFIVYFLSQVIHAFGINNYIPTMLAVWAPTLIVTMMSVSVLLHLEDG